MHPRQQFKERPPALGAFRILPPGPLEGDEGDKAGALMGEELGLVLCDCTLRDDEGVSLRAVGSSLVIGVEALLCAG